MALLLVRAENLYRLPLRKNYIYRKNSLPYFVIVKYTITCRGKS